MGTGQRIGYLGPEGSFSHQAAGLLGNVETVPFATIADVLAGVADESIDRGIVPLENAIEGTVSATLDGLIFDHELVIEQEVVLPIHLHLLARKGTSLEDVREVLSYTHALEQCRHFLRSLDNVTTKICASTSDAARLVSTGPAPHGAIASALAAEIFNLEIVASDIEDHGDNETRFIVVGRTRVPAPTGHDRTSIVCFQSADRPGSLYGMLGQFAARNLNLTKLESRPTKRGLGEYCFIIEFDGHVADEIVADCLADLQAHLVQVKFLGSYPVTGEVAAEKREEVTAAQSAASDWIAEIKSRIS